jgi:pilus assembly protein CpaB
MLSQEHLAHQEGPHMTRPKAVIVVSIFALLFAGAAAWLSYSYLQREMSSVKAVQPQKIVVATTDIPLGSAITEAQVKVAAWPKDSIPPGSAQQPDAVVGRVVIRPITGGDAVTEQKLKPVSGGAGAGFLTYVIPKGHRAVTVAVNEVAGVAGFLTPRDRVDVMVTAQLPNGDRESVSKIILENVPILATGQVTDQREGKPVIVPTVTLDLVPSDAEKLVLSASKGSLQLLLRNIADSGQVDSKGATISKVLTGVEIPATPRPAVATAAPSAAPPKQTRTVHRPPAAAPPVIVVKATPPPPSYTLEIVRGTEKSSRQYTE